jgi:hypothetical protein
MRTSLARSVILYMHKGAGVREAVGEGLLGLSGLKGGYQGQLAIFAVDKDGQLFVGKHLSEGPRLTALFWNGRSTSAQTVEEITVDQFTYSIRWLRTQTCPGSTTSVISAKVEDSPPRLSASRSSAI